MLFAEWKENLTIFKALMCYLQIVTLILVTLLVKPLK